MIFERKRVIVLVVSVVVGAAAAVAAPATGTPVVVPGAQTSVEGGFDNGFPFNLNAFPGFFADPNNPSMRYQQVYGASEFGALAPGGEFITGIAFRPDAGGGNAFSCAPCIVDIRIDLSTTSKAPDGLSQTFAENLGPDTTTVFNGALSLSSADTGPLVGPKDFDIVIPLAAPFFFDPAGGNLLLDVRNFSGGSTTQFDAVNATGDSVSRVQAFDVDSETGAQLAFPSLGLVTQFTTSPPTVGIPEPSTLVLLGAGLAGLLPRACRRSRR